MGYHTEIKLATFDELAQLISLAYRHGVVIVDGAGVIWIGAFHGDKPVGCCSVNLHMQTKIAEIGDDFVDPAQSSVIYTRMFNFREQLLQNMRCKRVLATIPQSELPRYLRAGFHIEGGSVKVIKDYNGTE